MPKRLLIVIIILNSLYCYSSDVSNPDMDTFLNYLDGEKRMYYIAQELVEKKIDVIELSNYILEDKNLSHLWLDALSLKGSYLYEKNPLIY
jgi:hypothetical protein